MKTYRMSYRRPRSNGLKKHLNVSNNLGIKKTSGFTVVELLVTIIIIGTITAITVVSYKGITQRASVTSLQSDLSNASDLMKIYQTHYASYPTAMTGNCPTAPTPDNAYCIKASAGNTLTYTSIAPSTFHITGTNTNNTYAINDTVGPAIATTPTGSLIGNACPTGFIPIPGSGTYGTNDFCVMKYAASQVGATTTPISLASALPWVNISQTSAIANSPNVAGCTGCHLITDAEYLTIAQNTLSVTGNWSTGIVGSGYIYSGHNDQAPDASLAANSSDANGYAGETNIGGNQKRTLILTNGQVIWDIAGNVWSWTSATINSQPGILGNGFNWREWKDLTTHGTLSPDPFPATTGITGASSWVSSNGSGSIYSSADDTTVRAFRRGGCYDGCPAGVLELALDYPPSGTGVTIGFRVTR